MKLTVFFCTFCWSFFLYAADGQSANQWLQRLSHSLQSLNFVTSFVVVKNNQAEPYHWFHGVNGDNIEFEILSRQNGLRRDVLRKDGIVSYIEPEVAPYSVEASRISGPIPAILSQDIKQISQHYDFVSMGMSRVLGKKAQLIRIVPKDEHRYGQWLWLDKQSALLLKLATTSKQGALLEQVQFTHLDITPLMPDNLQQLVNAQLPPVVDIEKFDVLGEFSWQVQWLPSGFEVVTANRHRIAQTQQVTEFMLFSDGLVDVSVYVSPLTSAKPQQAYVYDGATIAYNRAMTNFEINIVGNVPLATAEKIANSFTLVR